MPLHEETLDMGHAITGYDDTSIRVADQIFHQGLIISPKGILSPWGPTTALALNAEHIEPLLTREMEVLLLGTGSQRQQPDPALLAPLYSRGMEVMSTPSACRTYNILMSEGRQVVAALII